MAVASRNIDKAKAFVAENNLEGVATPYGSYQELLDNAGVDAVYIPLPCALHKEWVLKAAAAGKHILMEKPLAMVRACYVYTTVQPKPPPTQSYDDAKAMVDACRAANVQYMVRRGSTAPATSTNTITGRHYVAAQPTHPKNSRSDRPGPCGRGGPHRAQQLFVCWYVRLWYVLLLIRCSIDNDIVCAL